MPNTHGVPNSPYEANATWRDAFLGYAAQGGLPDTSPTLTVPPFTTLGYVADGPELVYVRQEPPAQGFPLTQGAGTYWLGLSRTTTSAPAGWQRWPGTHYLSFFGATPTLSAGLLPLCRLTV